MPSFTSTMATYRTIPAKVWSKRGWVGIVRKHGKPVEKQAVSQFKAVSAGWKHQPEWEHGISIAEREAQLTVTTDDKIFGFHNAGTRAHIIRPVNASILRFEAADGTIVWARVVSHPGMKARKHTKKIGKVIKPVWTAAMKAAMTEFRMKQR